METRELPVAVYGQGNVDVTTGSAPVFGHRTAWSAPFAGLDLILSSDGEAHGQEERYTISSVDAPTRLTLARPFAQASASARSYVIGVRA